MPGDRAVMALMLNFFRGRRHRYNSLSRGNFPETTAVTQYASFEQFQRLTLLN